MISVFGGSCTKRSLQFFEGTLESGRLLLQSGCLPPDCLKQHRTDLAPTVACRRRRRLTHVRSSALSQLLTSRRRQNKYRPVKRQSHWSHTRTGHSAGIHAVEKSTRRAWHSAHRKRCILSLGRCRSRSRSNSTTGHRAVLCSAGGWWSRNGQTTARRAYLFICHKESHIPTHQTPRCIPTLIDPGTTCFIIDLLSQSTHCPWYAFAAALPARSVAFEHAEAEASWAPTHDIRRPESTPVSQADACLNSAQPACEWFCDEAGAGAIGKAQKT